MGGFPVEIITMLASTIGGAVMKMWAQSQKDLAEERNWRMDKFNAEEDSRRRAAELNTPADMSMKKLLVVSVMLMSGYILLAPAFGLTTQVPMEVVSGFKFLFLDFTTTVTEYVQLEGVVTPDWLGHAILSVFGLYFGQSISSRK